MDKFITVKLSLSHIELLLKLLRVTYKAVNINEKAQIRRMIDKIGDAKQKGEI